MFFKDRQDAGKQLSYLLQKYLNDETVVFALPRGGVVIAAEIAKALHAPLDLILAHKIGHPSHAEYAIAAVSESGQLIKTTEAAAFGNDWIEQQKAKQIEEIKRKRALYLKDKPEIPLKNKIAIIVDDGIATGLTLKAGIQELKQRKPKKIVVAVPVSPKSTAEKIKKTVDDFISILTPDDYQFLGSVGAYFHHFNQVEDNEVIALLKESLQHIIGKR